MQTRDRNCGVRVGAEPLAVQSHDPCRDDSGLEARLVRGDEVTVEEVRARMWQQPSVFNCY